MKEVVKKTPIAGIFKREQRSLFGEILDWMLTPLLLLWPASLALTWLVAQNIADKPFDRALEYNVQALAQLVVVKDGKAQFNLPQPARELLRADDADQIYYQVIGLNGELMSGEKEVPAPPETIKASAWEVKLRDEEIRGLFASRQSGFNRIYPAREMLWCKLPKPVKNDLYWLPRLSKV